MQGFVDTGLEGTRATSGKVLGETRVIGYKDDILAT
jgi:hypothetical protein